MFIDMGSYLAEAGDPAQSIADGLLMGAGALGIIAIVVGILLLLLTLKFGMEGDVEHAVICGFALLTLISPVLAFVVAILMLIIMVIEGNPYLGVQAVVGFIVGMVINAIMCAVLIAMGMMVV